MRFAARARSSSASGRSKGVGRVLGIGAIGVTCAIGVIGAIATSVACGPSRSGAGATTTTTSNDFPSDAGAPADAAIASACARFLGDAAANGQWVSSAATDSSGQLRYATYGSRGDHVMDFSGAGYMGGGVSLPDVAARVTVHPSGADDTAAIQGAIDAVSKMPLEAGGLRGAVVLAAGTFDVAGTLAIAASGVVLRGSGSGSGGTEVRMTGSPHLFLRMAGAGTWKAGAGTAITDAYVPSGASSFHVASADGFAVGDAVLVNRPVTAAWVHFMGMDTLVRDGGAQTWLAPGTSIPTDRTIAAVDGNALTLDVPLSDSFDATYLAPPGATVAKYTFPGRITHVGLAQLRIVAPPLTVPIDAPTYTLIEMDAVADAWVDDVVGQDQFPDTIRIDSAAKRITIARTSLLHTAAVDKTAGYPVDFAIYGTQVLLQSCASTADAYFSVATHSRSVGPIVVLDFVGQGKSSISPHQRWGTGLLLDNVTLGAGGSILLEDRGTAGTGHGWTMGFGVVWNSAADALTIQKPPGSTNWAIGVTGVERTSTEPGRDGGAPLPEGTIDSPGKRVTPESLYRAQLCVRLGAQAVANLDATK